MTVMKASSVCRVIHSIDVMLNDEEKARNYLIIMEHLRKSFTVGMKCRARDFIFYLLSFCLKRSGKLFNYAYSGNPA